MIASFNIFDELTFGAFSYAVLSAFNLVLKFRSITLFTIVGWAWEATDTWIVAFWAHVVLPHCQISWKIEITFKLASSCRIV